MKQLLTGLISDLTPLDAVKIGAIGLVGGILSGLLGVSGGVVLVPALVLILAWDQHLAQGTALAVALPPVGILAVADYYREGHVHLQVALIMALGAFLGGYFGGKLASRIPAARLRQGFGGLLLVIGLKMALG